MDRLNETDVRAIGGDIFDATPPTRTFERCDRRDYSASTVGRGCPKPGRWLRVAKVDGSKVVHVFRCAEHEPGMDDSWTVGPAAVLDCICGRVPERHPVAPNCIRPNVAHYERPSSRHHWRRGSTTVNADPRSVPTVGRYIYGGSQWADVPYDWECWSPPKTARNLPGITAAMLAWLPD